MRVFLFAGVSVLALTTGLGVAHAETSAIDEAQGAARSANILQASQEQPAIQLAQNEPQQTGAPVVVQSEEEPETVLVFGRAERQIGIAGAASEGAIGGA